MDPVTIKEDNEEYDDEYDPTQSAYYRSNCLRLSSKKNITCLCVAYRTWPSKLLTVRQKNTGRKLPRITVFTKQCSRASREESFGCCDKAIQEHLDWMSAMSNKAEGDGSVEY